MARRKIDISLKKLPKQQRAVATVDAIIEAATYILQHAGPSGFTANRVAEKAGVNIASFYQYFPNKEALLFHITKVTWERQLAQLSPILNRPGSDHANKLREFVRAFFLVEAAEADLRQALKFASIELKDTKEYRALISEGAELFRRFIVRTVKSKRSDLEFDLQFCGLLITSFAERTTDERTLNSKLVRQADLLSDLLVAYFGI